MGALGSPAFKLSCVAAALPMTVAAAAMSKVKPSLTDPAIATFCAEVNVLGTANVLEAAEAFQVKKLVYAGELHAAL